MKNLANQMFKYVCRTHHGLHLLRRLPGRLERYELRFMTRRRQAIAHNPRDSLPHYIVQRRGPGTRSRAPPRPPGPSQPTQSISQPTQRVVCRSHGARACGPGRSARRRGSPTCRRGQQRVRERLRETLQQRCRERLRERRRKRLSDASCRTARPPSGAARPCRRRSPSAACGRCGALVQTYWGESIFTLNISG
jgi:hypothetical protein